jgi:hypothetical protein
MWRKEGGIQQVHETNEPDTIAASLKLQYKSKMKDVPKYVTPSSNVVQSTEIKRPCSLKLW